VVLATGSEPLAPPIPGLVEGLAFDDDPFFTTLPDRVCVIGGGAVGVEVATIFRTLGTDVTLVEMAGQLVPGLDPEMAGLLAESLTAQGVSVLLNAQVSAAHRCGGGWRLELEGESDEIEADRILVATGRRPRLDGTRATQAGVRLQGGWVSVDESMRTSAPGVFAAGDVTGRLLLAHCAASQGRTAALNALGGSETVDYDLVPRCVYSRPEVAWVGLSEEEARRRGYGPQVGRASFGGNGRALALGRPDGWVQVVAGERYGEILGMQVIGPHASELVVQGAIAMQLEGTLEEWERTIWPHPTLGEVVAEAVAAARG